MKTDKKFALLSSISCADPHSWEDKLFLTFDIDWAHDEIIEDVLQLLKQYSVPATLFATHKTSVLSPDLIQRHKHEIGLHPNFNQLLRGESNGKDFMEICVELKEIYPDATSVRSHSLCFGSLIQTAYENLGITHDSSVIVPYQDNSFPLSPWKMWDGLTRAPYFFCDYVTAMTAGVPTKELILRTGLRVFAFHPIHVFLNTESLERYERTRPFHHDPKELINHRFEGYGTRNRLLELLQLAGKS
jgi:hypothetical protein